MQLICISFFSHVIEYASRPIMVYRDVVDPDKNELTLTFDTWQSELLPKDMTLSSHQVHFHDLYTSYVHVCSKCMFDIFTARYARAFILKKKKQLEIMHACTFC